MMTGINPVDLGARPDIPSFDNSPYIQQAIDVAKAANSFVGFPEGNFYVSGGLKLSVSLSGHNTTITAIASQSPQLLYPKWYLFAIDTDVNPDLVIRDLIFDGNRAALEDLKVRYPEDVELELGLSENYAGLRRYSLIQAFKGFKTLEIRNCTFRDTVQGAIAIAPRELPGFGSGSIGDEIDAQFKGETKAFTRVEICDCKFFELRTEIANIFNLPASIEQLSGTARLEPKGIVILKDNLARDCGSREAVEINPNKMIYRWGNAFTVGNVNTLQAEGNTFERTARFDFKHGLVKNILIKNNTTISPYWGFVQTACTRFSQSHFQLGDVIICNNDFLAYSMTRSSNPVANNEVHLGESASLIFGQFRGETTAYDPDCDPSQSSNCNLLTEYQNLIIKNNTILYKNVDVLIFGRTIQISTRPKYRRIEVSDNTFESCSQAAIYLNNWQIDKGWKGSSVILRNNRVTTDITGNSEQSLLNCAFGSSPQLPLQPSFENLVVKDNYINGTVIGLRFSSNSLNDPQVIGVMPFERYFITGNIFILKGNTNAAIQWLATPPEHSLQEFHLTHNYFTKIVSLALDYDAGDVGRTIETVLTETNGLLIIRGNTYLKLNGNSLRDRSLRAMGLSPNAEPINLETDD